MKLTLDHEYEYYADDTRALALHLYDAHAYDAAEIYDHPANLGERERVENLNFANDPHRERLILNTVHETLHHYNIGVTV